MSFEEVLTGKARWHVACRDAGDFLKSLPEGSVHMAVTSPPYYGLRDYKVPGQLGLEPTPEEYVGRMVEVFRELRRVLRPDGTLWLNMGDSYATRAGTSVRSEGRAGLGSQERQRFGQPKGFKHKDLLGMPWSLAFALRGDGWWLRQDIVWHKTNPMPESVADRCSKAHEYLFLLAKSPAYFFDDIALREPPTGADKRTRRSSAEVGTKKMRSNDLATLGLTRGKTNQPCSNPNGKAKRSVWSLPVARFKGAHFATFPVRLVEPCVLAGTSARGVCPACGAPWTRQVSRKRAPTRPGADTKVTGVAMTDGNRDPQRHVTAVETTGWQPGCKCDAGPPVPAVVLDPFMGSGTVAEVAVRHGRKAIGCELNPDYLPLIEQRLAAVPPWETADAPATAPPPGERPGDDG